MFHQRGHRIKNPFPAKPHFEHQPLHAPCPQTPTPLFVLLSFKSTTSRTASSCHAAPNLNDMHSTNEILPDVRQQEPLVNHRGEIQGLLCFCVTAIAHVASCRVTDRERLEAIILIVSEISREERVHARLAGYLCSRLIANGRIVKAQPLVTKKHGIMND